jgi:hypothetical protein
LLGGRLATHVAGGIAGDDLLDGLEDVVVGGAVAWAASPSLPRKSSISAPDQIIAIGLAMLP